MHNTETVVATHLAVSTERNTVEWGIGGCATANIIVSSRSNTEWIWNIHFAYIQVLIPTVSCSPLPHPRCCFNFHSINIDIWLVVCDFFCCCSLFHLACCHCCWWWWMVLLHKVWLINEIEKQWFCYSQSGFCGTKVDTSNGYNIGKPSYHFGENATGWHTLGNPSTVV